jgi:6-phosphogluconolactonase (cycloisomerase 2 family)
MTLSRIGRISMALLVSVAMGLGMTSCGGGTVGFMWVIGSQLGATTGEIGGFKIDNFTGNLTGTVGSPYTSGGANPVMLALKSGGRYLYVLNAGDPTNNVAGGIALFSVGGDGVLSYQQSYSSQGTVPVWIATSLDGNYLFVLDQKAPDYNADATKGAINLNGSITAFSLDSNTGRPSLITNAQVKDANGTQLTYFEVGNHPTQMRASSNCVYTLDTGDQTIFPYAFSSGQLTQPTNSTLSLGTANATSVNVNGSSIYVTDAGSTVGGPGTILPFSAGSGSCALSTVTTGTVPNLTGASDPYQTLQSSDSKFLYVLNHSTPNTNYTDSSISAFTILSTGSLQPISGTVLNPYSVGAGPVCMAIDPTNQYIYTSDSASNTVTGKLISHDKGELSALNRGSTFPTVASPTCLVISANTGS